MTMTKIWAWIGPVVIVVGAALFYSFLTQEGVPSVYWQASAIVLGLYYVSIAFTTRFW